MSWLVNSYFRLKPFIAGLIGGSGLWAFAFHEFVAAAFFLTLSFTILLDHLINEPISK